MTVESMLDDIEKAPLDNLTAVLHRTESITIYAAEMNRPDGGNVAENGRLLDIFQECGIVDGHLHNFSIFQVLRSRMPPASRLTDMHVCPMVTPAPVPVPHVGGPIAGPGAVTVLIGKIPGSVMGDVCVCVGPPDAVAKGSTTVLCCKKPATRMGDPSVHGGSIVGCLPSVIIGG